MVNTDNQNITIFIFTCDAYSGIWDYSIDLFHKNFPKKYSQNLFLVTDKKPDKKYGNFYKGFNVIWPESNNPIDYIEKLSFALKHCKTEYFLYLLDDYFLAYPISETIIDNFMSFIKKNDANYLKLNIKSKNRLDKLVYKTKEEKYYSLKTQIPYAVDLYPSIWKKPFVQATCDNWPFKERTIWDYEGKFHRLGEHMSIRGCFINVKNSFPFEDGVRKGKILRKAYKILLKEYDFNLTTFRPLMTRKEYYKDKIIPFISRKMPLGLKKKLKSRNVKKGKKYYS